MENISKIIRERRSVRTFDGRDLSAEDKEKLLSFMESIPNPYGMPVKFKLMSAKENGLTCPVVNGTDLYVGGKIGREPQADVAFGYSFEALVLYAQSLGIGTVWLGGTMNRSAFEKAMELSADEVMPCASPLGYPAKKLSLRESVMRKAIKADERLPFEELFFDGSLDIPLAKEKAGILEQPLEMVRWAPSAVNKQPWRVIVSDGSAHFYLKRSKSLGHSSTLDMQKTDMGIALCHFALSSKENGIDLTFSCDDPKLTASPDMEYIASYKYTK